MLLNWQLMTWYDECLLVFSVSEGKKATLPYYFASVLNKQANWDADLRGLAQISFPQSRRD